MLLATWPLHDFARFLQIISWIILPFLLLAILFTLLMHYRQRRKNKTTALLSGAVPDEMSEYSNHKKLSFHHARYKSLKQDFLVLQQLYNETDQELSTLCDEMERQDYVIDHLRADLAERERQLSQMQVLADSQAEKVFALNNLLKEAHLQIEIMMPGNGREQIISMLEQPVINEQALNAKAW